jgi:hypothetical protein
MQQLDRRTHKAHHLHTEIERRHRFELVPHGDGTRLLQTESFTGMLVPIDKKSLDTGTVAGFRAMNVALKARAEAVAPGGAASTP